MIKDFRGQVKVSDIQAAFDEMTTRINNLVDTYNDAAGYQDIDYTKGAPKLGAANYTLTIAGLKSVLESYNNTLIGCNIFKIDDVTCLVTDGLFITSNNVYRVPSQIVSGEAGWDLSSLWLDISNEAVTFKQGNHGTIVTEQTTFTQPVITSNTSYGVFGASYSTQDAYKCTTNEGWLAIGGGLTSGQYLLPQVQWSLPKEIKATNISFDVSLFAFTVGILEVFGDSLDDLIYSEKIGDVSTQSFNKHINIDLNNKKLNNVTIRFTLTDNRPIFNITIKNLLISGTSETMAVDQGGVITPSPNIIKICDLNWRAKDGLIKDVKQLQIEKPVGYTLYMNNQSVIPEKYGSTFTTLDTSNGGKFVSYVSCYSTGSWESQANILGENIIDNPRDSGNRFKRSSYTAFSMSRLYIPKGCTDNLSGYGTNNFCGRVINNPVFEYKM